LFLICSRASAKKFPGEGGGGGNGKQDRKKAKNSTIKPLQGGRGTAEKKAKK